MTNRNHLITGGSSGIGAEVVDRLLARGDRATVLDRTGPQREDVTWVPVDLADPQSIEEAAASLEGTYQGVANVAGVPGTGGSDLTMRVNFLGLRALTEAVLDRLDRGSSIVNVSSRAGHQWALRLPRHVELARTRDYRAGLAWLREHPVSDNNAYPYSKEVVRVWSQLRAGELIGRGIRVNAVSPGPVDTPIFADFKRLLGEERVNDGVVRGGGRPGTPADIAPIITWLLSGESGWVSGADIPVDGGLAATYVETPVHEQPGIRTEF